MKSKVIWVVLSVLVVLGLILASCAKAPEAPAAPTAPATPAAPAAPAVVEKPAPPKQIVWRVQYGTPAAPEPDRLPGLPVKNEIYLNQIFEANFPGRFKMELLPAGSVVPESEQMLAIGKGTLDAGSVYGGFHSGVMPEVNIEIGLPFQWEEAGEGYDALEHFGLREYMQEVYGERNIYYVGTNIGAVQGLGGYVGINTEPSYFKGKRVRAVGIYQKWVQALGGSGVLVSYSDMYMALKLGTIDGIILSVPALDTIKAKEVLDCWVMYPNTIAFNSNWLINKDSLNALPDDIKTFMITETKHILAWYNIVRAYNEQRWRATQAEKDGYIVLTRYSEEDADYVRNIGYGLWDDVAKLSPRSARGVELARKQMRALGRMK